MPSLDQGLSELQDKFETLLRGVDTSIHVDAKNKFDSLKKALKSNASLECTCERQCGFNSSPLYNIKLDCPVHKGNLNNLALCPLHMEDYTCAWHPTVITCGDTPCSNAGEASRGLGLNTQGYTRDLIYERNRQLRRRD